MAGAKRLRLARIAVKDRLPFRHARAIVVFGVEIERIGRRRRRRQRIAAHRSSPSMRVNASRSPAAIGTRCFSSGNAPALHVGDIFAERRDPLLLQTVELGAEVAVDLRVARLVSARIAEHVLSEEILRVATPPRAHRHEQQRRALADLARHALRHDLQRSWPPQAVTRLRRGGPSPVARARPRVRRAPSSAAAC